MLKPKCRVWLEKAGRPVFGEGRARLLAAVEEHGSLRAAAACLGMSYRTAWLHLRKIEGGLDYAVVERRKGGAGGGGMRLTRKGRGLLDRYRDFRERLETQMLTLARKCRL